MELITVDPRSLRDDPNNPRRTAAGRVADDQLTANIRAVGILQPPVVRPAGDGLMIIAGHRRVRCAIAAGLDAITVLVRGADDGSDAVRAVSHNVVFAPMSIVDNWRAVEALISADWTEDAIAAALALPTRTIRKLRLLANLHPPMLEQMNRGDMPDERDLRIIAAATVEEQSAVWKKHKPKKNETTAWWQVAQALEKRRMAAKDAKFGPEQEQAFGIVWTEDLFAPADEDSRTTDQLEAFLAAQQAWIETNLPKKGVILAIDDYGRPSFPRGAVHSYGKPAKGDTIGCYVDPRSGAIQEVAFRVPKAPAKAAAASDDDDGAEEAPVKNARANISRKGIELIGQIRTQALRQALLDAEIDDDALLGILVLALAGNNVTINGGHDERHRIARHLVHGATIVRDGDLIRAAARQMAAAVLSCRVDYGSGVLARIVGESIHADACLPNMANDDVLSCLTKTALEAAASAENVPPRQRAKDTRAALIERFAGGTYVLPAARFAITAAEAEDLEPIDSIDDDDTASGPEDDAEEPVEMNGRHAAGVESAVALDGEETAPPSH
jgi:ParB family transcriptional regulator, chromosome partitioning protein